MDPLFREALARRGPGYVPRTRHLLADGSPRYTNRLILESSPYLLQHAHNPVDWHPWGDAAFELARQRDCPVFLSIGYSTCHWCHVMEEESFEDEEIALLLSSRFVPVKVDREERPDVDAVYMAVVQALTGRGGWPMSVFLTPSREPFFGGTYFPPRRGSRGARNGFFEVLGALADAYAGSRTTIVADAERITERVRAMLRGPASSGPIPEQTPDLAVRFAAHVFDPENGGRRGSPKFPSSFPTRFLLRRAQRTGEPTVRAMATTTLRRMHEGGIHDHVGGGFHRYSTDARWLVPHFEKMLYDNAMLALAYLEAGDPTFAAVAEETLDYLLREMRSPEGTFHSATDADSPTPGGTREEGYYFTFTPAELRAVLAEQDAELVEAVHGVTEEGNFEGRSVLSLVPDPDRVALAFGTNRGELDARLRAARAKLYDARLLRPPPIRDEKVLVSWNALVISALARSALVRGRVDHGEAAVRAASVLVEDARKGQPLPHLRVDGEARGKGFLDDHTYLAAALLDVFELGCEPAFLEDAIRLLDDVERRFLEPGDSAYSYVPNDGEVLLAREKPMHDGPVPSPNSIAALASLRLATLLDDERYRQRAERILGAFAGLLPDRLPVLESFLLALEHASSIPKEVVLVVPEGRGVLAAAARPFLDRLGTRVPPNAAFVVATEDVLDRELAALVPWARGKTMVEGKTTAYVCERGTCMAPTTEPEVFAALLDG